MLPDPSVVVAGLDETPTGLAVWDAAQELVYANRPFRHFFQIDETIEHPLTYRDFLSAMTASHEFMLARPPEVWIDEELSLFGEERGDEQMTADGRTLEIIRRPVRGDGMTMTVRDISTVRQTESALRRAKAEAETSDDAKSRFLRAANHDLRQPLSTLKILIFSCMEEADEQHRKDILHAMDISVSIMEDLLGALLQIGQLDAGQITPRISTFQLGSTFERLRIQYEHVAQEKGLKLRFVGTNSAVVSDKALLERVLSNIVGNAIRYTDFGGVLVGCRNRNGSLHIEIRDSGRGITADDTVRIFDEFYQVPDGRRVKRPGLGLGLSIVRRVAEILGHEVNVRSAPGRGSTFTIVVPRGDIWLSEMAGPEISEAIGGEFAALPILLIEDDSVLRQATSQLLERWGIHLSAVTTSAEALQILETSGIKPRLIIADYSLAREFGTDVVRKIREHLFTPIPAIVTTAEIDPQVINRIRDEGFPILIKPVSPPRLRVLMHNLLFEPGLFTAAERRKK